MAINNTKYLNNKEKRAQKALEHTRTMRDAYGREIAESVKNSIIYSKHTKEMKADLRVLDMELADITTEAAAIQYADGKTAVLNFASYKYPGGGFIAGSYAQEEALCHASFLYNVLCEFQEYYEWNRKNTNHGLYKNRAIYSPNVMFHNDNGEKCVDVITCAAPNWSAAKKDKILSAEDNLMALNSRIRFIKEIVEENHVDTLILGAFGCGVFGQNAKEVAQCFRSAFMLSSVKKIVFAVPKLKDPQNHEAFKKVMNTENP